jgi:hypothetical protein
VGNCANANVLADGGNHYNSDNPVEMWNIRRKKSKALIIKHKFEIWDDLASTSLSNKFNFTEREESVEM